ncbi:MAG: transglutaminase-like cysteine peptidase [Alphaproteobacteria bacterium]
MSARSTSMPGGPIAWPPCAWRRVRERLKKLPAPCEGNQSAGTARRTVAPFTPALIADLVGVNDQANWDIDHDRAGSGAADRDQRRPAQGYGKSEAVALAKRERLVALGWPPDALRLARCVTERAEPHAVLTIETDNGTWVLDNRRRGISAWSAVPYRWLAREVPGRFLWQRIRG